MANDAFANQDLIPRLNIKELRELRNIKELRENIQDLFNCLDERQNEIFAEARVRISKGGAGNE